MGGALTLGLALIKRPTVKGILISAPAINMHADPNYSEATRVAGKGTTFIIGS